MRTKPYTALLLQASKIGPVGYQAGVGVRACPYQHMPTLIAFSALRIFRAMD